MFRIEAAAWIPGEQLLLIDVREDKRWSKGHLPNAVHLAAHHRARHRAAHSRHWRKARCIAVVAFAPRWSRKI